MIVVADVMLRCMLHQYLIAEFAIFCLLRCSIIYCKIVEPGMFDVVSVQLVLPFTSVVCVNLQIT